MKFIFRKWQNLCDIDAQATLALIAMAFNAAA